MPRSLRQGADVNATRLGTLQIGLVADTAALPGRRDKCGAKNVVESSPVAVETTSAESES